MEITEQQIGTTGHLIDKRELSLRLNDVEKNLADLIARWPFHSVQAWMVSEREDLEEQREQLLRLLNQA